ncbi:MAG TPA: hypothetical protein VFV08_06045 [Puia sp.]|nr:hypothetical protein [Puia sp.]
MIKEELSSAVDYKSKEGKALLYALGIGLILSDIIPTPADAVYFNIERNLRNKWQAGTITPGKYWGLTTAAYYGLNPVWWTMVLGVLLLTKGSALHKLKIGSAIIGSGAVIAVVYKNIQADKKQLEQQQQGSPTVTK